MKFVIMTSPPKNSNVKFIANVVKMLAVFILHFYIIPELITETFCFFDFFPEP